MRIYVRPWGNNGNPGTLVQPKLTVMGAVAVASSGDVVDVYGTVAMGTNGAISINLTIEGQGPASEITLAAGALYTINTADVQFRKLKLAGLADFTDNVFSAQLGAAVRLYRTTFVAYTAPNGVLRGDGFCTISAEQCTFVSLSNAGICFYDTGAAITIRNSIVAFFENGYYSTGTAIDTNANCWFNAVNYAELPPGILDIQEDPGFVDRISQNFVLRIQSPCIDVGLDLGYEDYSGPAPDMGSLEFSQNDNDSFVSFYNFLFLIWLFSESLSDANDYLQRINSNRALATCDSFTLSKKYAPELGVVRPPELSTEEFRTFLQSLVGAWLTAPARVILDTIIDQLFTGGYYQTEYYRERRGWNLGTNLKLFADNSGPNPFRANWNAADVYFGRQWYRLKADYKDVASAGKINGEVLVSTGVETDQNPAIAWNGTAYGIVWKRVAPPLAPGLIFGLIDRQGNRIDSGDLVLETLGGATILGAPRLVWNGTEFFVLWASPVELKFARVSASGSLISPATSIIGTPTTAFGADIAWNGTEYGVTWVELVSPGNYRINFCRLNTAGVKITANIPVTPTGVIRFGVKIAWNSMNSEWGFVYSSVNEVWFRRVDNADVVQGAEINLSSFGAQTDIDPDVVWNSTDNEYAVVWTRYPFASARIVFRRFDYLGTPVGPEAIFAPVAGQSQFPRITWTGTEFGIVWQDTAPLLTEFNVYITRIANDGTLLSVDQAVTSQAGPDLNPHLSFMGEEYGIVYFSAPVGFPSAFEVYLARWGGFGTAPRSAYLYLDGTEDADRYAVMQITTDRAAIPDVSYIMGKVEFDGTGITMIWGSEFLGVDSHVNEPEVEGNGLLLTILDAGVSIFDTSNGLIVLLRDLLPKILSPSTRAYVRFVDDVLYWLVKAS